MTDRIEVAGLSVAEPLHSFVEGALPQAGLDAEAFWQGVAQLLADLTPRNAEVLRIRDELQSRIDEFHRASPGPVDPEAYLAFLREIGYLAEVDESAPAAAATAFVTTEGVDEEIRQQSGPQLVVPLLNRRFAANAVNARWGSLYDALYGTDAIDRSGRPCRGREL